MRLIAPYPHAQVMWRLGISQSRFIKTLKYNGVAIDPAVDGKRSRVGVGFGVGLGVLLG